MRKRENWWMLLMKERNLKVKSISKKMLWKMISTSNESLTHKICLYLLQFGFYLLQFVYIFVDCGV